MFVALRDLGFAKGRFVLIGCVVALITLLVGFLSGLTSGLAHQNVSAVMSIPADRIVFSAPAEDSPGASFAESALSDQQVAAWKATDGVDSVDPLGISQTRGESESAGTAIAVFGVPPEIDADAPTRDGVLHLSEGAAQDLEVTTGDDVTIGGIVYTVESVRGDRWYSHTPVVRMTLHDWQELSAATGQPQAHATVLAVTGAPDWDAADAAQDTVSESTLGSLTALSSFRSEIGSLLLMVSMLFAISGLVIGAFFTVWTMQRKDDIAVLKALGASTRSLIRDALGQALLVLLLGIGVGLVLISILGVAASSVLPFLLSPVTTVLPGAIMIALGLTGTLFALRSVTSADPLAALGSNR